MQSPPPRLTGLFLTLLTALLSALLSADAMGQTTPCNATAHHTVATNTTVDLSSWYPSGSSATGKVIEIQAGGTLNVDKSFTFVSCKFRCSNGAAVVTDDATNGIALTALGCQFYTCDDSLWQGMTVNAGARINLQHCWLRDAVRAIYFPPGYVGTANVMRHNVLENNFRGMVLGDIFFTAGATVAFTYCFNNTFYQTVADIKGSAHINAHSGILVDRNSILIFGTPGGPRNVFDSLGFGIYLRRQAHAVVTNSIFRDMWDAFEGDGNDRTGIYVSGSSLTVTQAGGQNCIFNNNRHAGIRINNAAGPITIEDAAFSGGQAFGIRSVYNNTATTIDFSRDTFMLSYENATSAIYHERQPGFQLDGLPSNIADNVVTVTNDASPDLINGSTSILIDVRGNTGASDPMYITGNHIDNGSEDRDLHGIFARGAGDDWQITNNTVSYDGPTGLGYGYQFNNFAIAAENMHGEGTVISFNEVTSILEQGENQTPEFVNMSYIKCAIHVVDCNEPTICSNSADNTQRGFHLAQSLPFCVFGLNQMYRHVHPLHCSNGLGIVGANLTDIGNQFHTGNTWSTDQGDIFPIGVAALYADNDNVPFTFYVDETPSPALPAGLSYMPPSGIPALENWFQDEDHEVVPCVQTFGKNDPRFSDGELEIARGNYPYGYAAEHWDQRRQLWYKLSRHPDWAFEDEDVKDFNTATLGTSPQRFAAALWQFEQAFAPSAGVAAELDDLHEQYRDLVKEIVALNEEIGEDTTALNSLAAADLDERVGELAAVAADLADVVEDYTTERNARLEVLQDTLAVLPDEEPWEQAWIALLEVATRRGLAGEDEEMDETDGETLRAIAEACPQSVGLARQIAVTYMTPEDGHLYMGREDSEGCDEYGEERASPATSEQHLFLSPNPARRRVMARLPSYKGANCLVLDVWGRIVATNQIPEGQATFDFRVEDYPPGFYFLQAAYPDGQRSTARFSVVK